MRTRSDKVYLPNIKVPVLHKESSRKCIYSATPRELLMTAIGQWIISEQTDEWPPQDPLHPYFQKKKEYDIKLADGRHEMLCMWDKINARVCTLPKPPNPDRYVVTRKGLDPNGLLSQRPMEKGQRAPKRKRQLGIWKRRLIHRDMLKAGKDNTCSGCFVRGRTCPECKKK